MKRAVLLLLLISVPLAGGATDDKVTAEPEAVILLHGLGRTDRSMRPLEKRLRKAGFRVYNLRYSSTEKSHGTRVRFRLGSGGHECAEEPESSRSLHGMDCAS